MAWNTDDLGIRRFTSPEAPGWVLTIYPNSPSSLDVDTGAAETDVYLESKGIQVFGEATNDYYHSAVRFTIPWSIIREIVRFQDSVQSSTSM